jgi:hypothetical protein
MAAAIAMAGLQQRMQDTVTRVISIRRNTGTRNIKT